MWIEELVYGILKQSYKHIYIYIISGKEPEVIKKSNVLSLFIHGAECTLKTNQTNHLTINTVPLMTILNDKDVY